jgi:hypothetical protein
MDSNCLETTHRYNGSLPNFIQVLHFVQSKLPAAVSRKIIFINQINTAYNTRLHQNLFMVACTGPPATISCEPRQARKGAAAAVDSGAGVWLVQVTSIPCLYTARSTDS